MRQAILRLILLGLTAAMLLHLAGCRSAQRGRSDALPPTTLRSPLQTPPGIEPALLTPLTGDALDKARTPLDDILAQLPVPDELEPAAPSLEDDGDDSNDAEPPLQAQQAYLRGRAALLEGDGAEAINQLQQSLKLDENNAASMRLLGQIYAAGKDGAKAARYFSEAVQHDPAHAGSLFVLGRFAIEQSDWPRAAMLLHEAIVHCGDASNPHADTATASLSGYYLALALSRMGYALAALDQYMAFLHAPLEIRGPQGVVREMVVLRRQDPLTWQTIGDLYQQLDQPHESLDAYQTATTTAGPNAVLFDLIPRLVYAQLRLNQTQQAVDVALADARRTHGGEQALSMIGYLAGQGVDRAFLARLLSDLRKQDAEADTADVVIAEAALYPPTQVHRLLQQRLDHHPDELAVFEHLLSCWIDDATQSDALADAIGRTARLMAQHPDQAETFAVLLLRHVGDADVMGAALDQLPHSKRDDAMVLVIEGMLRADQGDADAAQQALEHAFKLKPHALVTHLQLARLRVVQDQFDEAAKLLKPFDASDDPGVVALRVRVMIETGKTDEASALLDKLIAGGKADVALILQQAHLQLRQGDAAAAERTLQEALSQQPTQEPLYEALFQLYEARDAQGQPLIANAPVQSRQLLQRLLTQIPDSRLGKLKRAELHIASRDFGPAIALLSDLAQQDHRDLAVLSQLLQVLVADRQQDKAVALIQQRVEEDGRNVPLLRLATAFYRTIGDQQHAVITRQRLLDLLPESDDKLLGQAALYLGTNRADAAQNMLSEALDKASVSEPLTLMILLTQARMQMQQGNLVDDDFRKAIAKYPQHEADLRYRWAISHVMRGDEDGYLNALVDVHEKFPDYSPANNDLGYLWLERDEHLDEALAMIHKAVDVEPNNAAYLDSLGWAYFKLGRFGDAVDWLRKADQQAQVDLGRGGGDEALSTRAVVLNHLGDALYRADRPVEASLAWKLAQRVLSNLPQDNADDELTKIRASLTSKLDAVHNKQPPLPPKANPPEAQPSAEPPAPPAEPQHASPAAPALSEQEQPQPQ